MDSKEIISILKSLIKQLKEIRKPSSELSDEISLEIGEKEVQLIRKISVCFEEILSDKLIIKTQKDQNNFWILITKHFNNPLVSFCRKYDKYEMNNTKKGEIWIFLSILEKSFSESIKEIYNHNLEEKFYEKNSIFRKCKFEIINELNELNQIHFVNIKNKDYERYQEFLKNNLFLNDESNNNYSNSNLPSSPIFNNFNNRDKAQSIFSHISEIPLINIDIDSNSTKKDKSNESIHIFQEEKEFTTKKYVFSSKIINNFYSFKEYIPLENINLIIDNHIDNDINNINNEEEINLSKSIDKEPKVSSELKLNPINIQYLPTDKLYEIDEEREYTKNDIIIYKKIKRRISNCLLLYINKYYKKTLCHKFKKHNMHNRPISLKKQNYQCYICLKKFSMSLNIPTEPIFWCSYYMRFVCKNCIDNEYSIIPYFIFEKWCFDKFSISKRAKITLDKWYNKPIIYFKNEDKLLTKIKSLNKIIEIKHVINNILNFMKCKNKFKFIEEKLGEYEYLALKEYLFSLRDLVEINSQTFYKKIVDLKDKFINHISGECLECNYDGEICSTCCLDIKIFFYDFEKVFFCKICRKSFHRKCIGLGHFH